MSEPTQTTVAKTKKAFHNLAVGYAVVVPAVSVIYILLFIEKYHVLIVPAGVALLIFGSSFAMGIVSLFDKSAGDRVRALVVVSMLVSAACGALGLLMCFFSGWAC